MKKFYKLFVVLTLIFCLIISYSPNKTEAHASGRAEIAMDLDTQTVLFESSSNVRLPMASTTKIMTAILAIEDLDLDKTIVVPDEAVGIEGSSVYLKQGQHMTIRDLLYGLMLRSGNDCATALAILHSGSIKSFVDAMNLKAQMLGCTNTHFCNPSGLPNDQHFTTARDLCKIACYAMKNEIFKAVVSSKYYDSENSHYVNKNKMLTSFDGANGVKTGYTTKAGRCLVSSANRGGMTVVCVVLDCYDMYERSKAILTNCFNSYEYVTVPTSKIFLFEGNMLHLVKDGKFIIKRGSDISYKITRENKQEGQQNGTNCEIQAKLNILSQNNLIFTQNLYNIDTVQK